MDQVKNVLCLSRYLTDFDLEEESHLMTVIIPRWLHEEDSLSIAILQLSASNITLYLFRSRTKKKIWPRNSLLVIIPKGKQNAKNRFRAHPTGRKTFGESFKL